MSDTKLILHVKGTEAETKELPKAEVKTAIAEGRLSQSQLIWSAPDQMWKQARELPELVSGETLILHVKGTESETREVPKPALREAISKGEITHSQLIWSPLDSAWKPVREIPDLMPGETLILHVKGTESETRELPRPAIRAAVSKGEITHSQLIWSPLDSAWKPVSQMPELMPGESLILHVKGTEAETTEMPKQAIRTAISQGKITHSQLIWNTTENQWKQVRDLPELLPIQKLAPAPERKVPVPTLESVSTTPPQVHVPRVAAVAVAASATPRARPSVQSPPKVTISPSATATPRPKVSQATAPTAATPAGHAPRIGAPSAAVRAAVAAGPMAASGPRPVVARAVAQQPVGPHSGHVVEEEEEGFHPVKWICIGVGALVLLIILANYLLVDRRLQSNYADTSYAANVGVYAHYAAFLQPSVIVIHIPPSDKLTPDNLSDFLVALAHSTPQNALSGDLFERIALTSGWTAQYTLSGYSWKQLGDMQRDSAAQRKDFIMAQISDARGEPLMPQSTLNEAAQDAQRERAWKEFVGHFTKP
jgi:hypothetical protein